MQFSGTELDDDKKISSYGIKDNDTIIVMLRQLRGGSIPPLCISDLLLDQQFNYDFTNVDDGNTKFYRGGKRYYRPCGWKQFALKVKGKYEDDKWLGEPGYRRGSSEGEWPVSYHGTGENESYNIAQEGFKLSKWL